MATEIIKDADEECQEDGSACYPLDSIEQDDPVVRKLLDNAICFTLLDLAKSEEFIEIVVGAMMMQAGAKLRPKDKRRLRKIVAYYPEGDTWLPENGFSNVGQAQFSAALDHYHAGTPRDFKTPRWVLVKHGDSSFQSAVTDDLTVATIVARSTQTSAPSF